MLSIGELAARTGCKVPTIRYYEGIGMMPEPERTEGNQRRYAERHVDRLNFIRHARELGFPLNDVRTLLDLADRPAASCEAADAIARRQLRAVERRLASLSALKLELERMIAECAGGIIADCRVVDVLSDHAKCLTDDHRLHDDGATP